MFLHVLVQPSQIDARRQSGFRPHRRFAQGQRHRREPTVRLLEVGDVAPDEIYLGPERDQRPWHLQYVERVEVSGLQAGNEVVPCHQERHL